MDFFNFLRKRGNFGVVSKRRGWSNFDENRDSFLYWQSCKFELYIQKDEFSKVENLVGKFGKVIFTLF